jgi:hypothetical protein
MARATAAVAVAGISLSAPASASPVHAACGTAGPFLDGVIVIAAPAGDAVNQRSGTVAISSTNCPVVGVLQANDDAQYYCWTSGDDGFTWTYLRNLRTGVAGWSRDNLLDYNGSSISCGF